MIASKIDTNVQSLLKAQIALDKYSDKTGHLKVTSSLPLLKHLEAKRLAQEVKDLQTLELGEAEITWLKGELHFTEEFIKWLQDIELPKVSVIIKDGNLEITAKGSLAELILTETPLLALISEHYYNVALSKMNFTDELVLSEAVRRFQTKSDILREIPNFKMSLTGTSNRYSLDWYNLLITMLIGEFGVEFLSIDNPIFGLMYNLPVKSYLNSNMWEDDWPVKDIYPNCPAPDDWLGSRYVFKTVEDFIPVKKKLKDDYIFVLSDLSAFDIAHLKSHTTIDNIIFEFNEFFTNDVPIRRPNFNVTRKISN